MASINTVARSQQAPPMQISNRSATPNLQGPSMTSVNKQSLNNQHRHSQTSLKESPPSKAHAKFLASGGRPLWDNSTSQSSKINKAGLTLGNEFQKSTVSSQTAGGVSRSARKNLVNIRPIEDMELINQWIGGDSPEGKVHQSFDQGKDEYNVMDCMDQIVYNNGDQPADNVTFQNRPTMASSSARVSPQKHKFHQQSPYQMQLQENRSEMGSPSDFNPLTGLAHDIENTQKELTNRQSYLIDEKAHLQASLKSYKGDLSLIFQGQKELEALYDIERQKESQLITELNNLQQLLRVRQKDLVKVQSEAKETLNGYQNLAGGMYGKIEARKEMMAHEREARESQLQEEREAIGAYQGELEKRQFVCDRLRQEVSARAQAKGEKEKVIADAVDLLKKKVDRKVKI